jgi:tetratricopeptide (TPR) repeat protein
MKQDEFSARMAGIVDFYSEHKNRVALAVLAAVGALAVALGAYYYIRSQQNRAAAAFATALNTYHSPVLNNPPSVPNLEYYPTNDAKNEKALEGFNSVAEGYSSYAAGRLARYYAAICLRELGRHDEAETEFEALTRSGDEGVASLAKLGLASVYEATGRGPEAETIYRDLEEHPTEAVPAVTARIARANLYRQTDPAQAATLYRQVLEENRGTAAGDYAEAMLAQLPQ